MAQAVNPDDIAQSPNNNINNNNNNQNSNNQNVNTQQAPSDNDISSNISSTAKSIKDSTISGAKYVGTKSKERLSLEGQLKQARISLERFVNPKLLNKQISQDTSIPKWVLKRAKGLVFLTVIKAGFLFAGNIGTGCVIVRKPNGGWTGPSSIGVAGVSFGFLVGASKIDYIMILPDDNAVKQFTGKGQLRLGGELQLAIGPIGRDGSGSVGAGDKGVSVIYSYSHAQGLYGGLALDGKVISVRPDCNKNYYKKSIDCNTILNGNIDQLPSNQDYDMIVHLLDSYCLDNDMTPIKGEKLSIDDLNNNNNDNNHTNDDQKQQLNGNNDNPSMMSKVSTSFSAFTSSVSSKFLSLTSSDKNQNKKKNKDVKLQKSGSNQNQNKNQNQNVVSNNKNYQIGGDDKDLIVPDYDDDIQ